jgi:2-oxoglutarate ferredoxin oxidoreductase subunit alpha
MSNSTKPIKEISSSVLRFAGDSGDGMQLVGDQFTSTSALSGEFFATLPDYPSEIRAPAGTTFGVSGFQVCIGSEEVFTPGDSYDVLIAMNPAALKGNLAAVAKNGIILANEDAFTAKNLEKAGYKSNPFDSPDMAAYQVLRVPMTALTSAAIEELGLSPKDADRCKNFFSLGIVYWLFNRDPRHTRKWIDKKFAKKEVFLRANAKTFEAGIAYANDNPLFTHSFKMKKPKAALAPGTYRNVTGNQAMALGLIAAAQKAGLKLFLGSYPITPATDIMHELVKHRDFATVLQAEDEIAAIGSAIGASFGGALAATTTSGPGFSLKSEFMNLAVMVELPLVIVDVQRGGPSTGLATKTEQADLLQALWGRHGESPIVVLAPSSPKDCFSIAVEAAKIAIKYMTPVIVLSEGYLGNGSEVWRIPSLEELPDVPVHFRTDPANFMPYERDPETLARPWVMPGTPGLEHRIGGIEKEDKTGTLSLAPLNHEKMVGLRAAKIAKVANEIPPTEVYGHASAELLVLGWGSTAGVIKHCVRKLSQEGLKVACAHIRHLNPLPPDLEAILRRYKKTLLPENNSGQLRFRLRGEYLIDTIPLNKVQGQPFDIDEIESKIRSILGAH